MVAGLKEGERNPTDNNDPENIIAARAALLDLYGDRATAFVSLFIASIFGLVTISAIVQAMLFSMVDEEAALSQFLYFKLSLNAFFIFLSAVLYIAFVGVALYTYKRYTFYADWSDKLTRYEICESAKLGYLSIPLSKKIFNEKQIQDLKLLAKNYASKLKDDEKYKAKIIETATHWKISFAFYQEYTSQYQKESRVKKFLGSKHFKLITCLTFLGLALLTYYPLINRLLKYLFTGL